MAGLNLHHIYKVYPNGTKAVSDFNIDIEDKEFIVFVGPSGCGKSTTLRMIAGLEEITSGDLLIGDEIVNEVTPDKRDIAMVFQNYALYPHMTVFDNMAFGLRNRKVPEEIIREKIAHAAKILDIESYLQKKPKEMSGGQRQRVALGRAIVRDPKVFLLDEPLSNLDAKLRASMRSEITKLHKKLGTTFIYVTHDQVEAMTMGTRIVVMKLGVVQQIDTPMNLYDHPYNKFVAGFIGTPQMNFFDVKLLKVDDSIKVIFSDDSFINVPYWKFGKIHRSYLNGDKTVTLGIRPEHIYISENQTSTKKKGEFDRLICTPTVVEELGNESIIYTDLGNLSAEQENDMEVKKIPLNLKSIVRQKIEIGSPFYIEFDEDRIHFFDRETEKTLLDEIPESSNVTATIVNNQLNIFGKKTPLVPALNHLLDGTYHLEIPFDSFINGNAYRLMVNNCEPLKDGRFLINFKYEGFYIYTVSTNEIAKGTTCQFDLDFSKIEFSSNGKVFANPISAQEVLEGKFAKYTVKNPNTNKKEDIYQYEISDNIAFVTTPEIGKKILFIEGKPSLKKTYKYKFSRETIISNQGTGFAVSVKQILDYGKVKFALLDVDGQLIKMSVDETFNEDKATFYLDTESVEVWEPVIDYRVY